MKKLTLMPTRSRESLLGLAVAHQDIIRVHYDPHYVVRADACRGGRSRHRLRGR